jgi:hypothetical protein
MNLILRPLSDVSGITWSIIWLMIILLICVLYVIYYILGIDEREEYGSHDTTEQKELLQLPGDGDKPCS